MNITGSLSSVRVVSCQSTSMADSLEDLWAKMSLKENEQETITIEEEWLVDTLAMGSNCLVCKVLTRRNLNLEAMQKVFMRIWRLRKGFTIREVGGKLYVFQFEDWVDKEVVLHNQPWNFNKSLLIFQEFDGMKDPESMVFETCPFWIQVHGLPFALMNSKIAKVIGRGLGHVLEVESSGDSAQWGKYLKMRVNVNIHKPLSRGARLAIPNGESVVVLFKYEHLPDFCYVCGRLDHTEGECEIAFRMRKLAGNVRKEYGAWLRADGGSQHPISDSFAEASFSEFDTGEKHKRLPDMRSKELVNVPIHHGDGQRGQLSLGRSEDHGDSGIMLVGNSSKTVISGGGGKLPEIIHDASGSGKEHERQVVGEVSMSSKIEEFGNFCIGHADSGNGQNKKWKRAARNSQPKKVQTEHELVSLPNKRNIDENKIFSAGEGKDQKKMRDAPRLMDSSQVLFISAKAGDEGQPRRAQ